MAEQSTTTNPSRRLLLASGVAAVVTLPIAAAASSDLAALIEAHRAAYRQADAAAEIEEAARDAAAADDMSRIKIVTRRGAQWVEATKIDREEFKTMIASDYESARRDANSIRRTLKSTDLFDANIAAIADAEAGDMAAIDAAYDEFEKYPPQRALREATAALRSAYDIEEEAAITLCEYPCRTLDEANRKAAYVLGETMWKHMKPPESQAKAFLKSLLSA